MLPPRNRAWGSGQGFPILAGGAAQELPFRGVLLQSSSAHVRLGLSTAARVRVCSTAALGGLDVFSKSTNRLSEGFYLPKEIILWTTSLQSLLETTNLPVHAGVVHFLAVLTQQGVGWWVKTPKPQMSVWLMGPLGVLRERAPARMLSGTG